MQIKSLISKAVRNSVLGVAVLMGSNAFAQWSDGGEVIHSCEGTRHKFVVQVISQDNPNAEYVLRLFAGYDTTQSPIYERVLVKRDPARPIDNSMPENTVWLYDIQGDSGASEIFIQAGRIYQNYPVDPRTGVSFMSPMTTLIITEGDFDLNEVVICDR